ncbi:MAG: hypothetical protein PHU49_08815 [Syntrophorhabdaceae bacterium]|nr:hypothetical protein [Syntrophorhabdaceae bacterium]MDD5244106.1 hypothetical protein [Syntrophorhabdaceae bacterium]
MSELRKDPVSGSWVVVGYHTTKSSSTGICPFCPGNENLTPNSIREYKDSQGNWLVRCFPASNPIFVIEVDENKRAEGIYDKMGNVGAHEIIIENRSHTKTMSGFSEQEFLLLFDMYRDRIVDLKRDMRFKHIQVFKNHGELSGSYIFHPHSHVLATPIVPSGIAREITNARNHYLQKERCLLCDILSQEMRQNKRVVMMNTNFIAICPFASRFPYEVWILPRFHAADFERLTTEGIKKDFALAMLDIMKRVEKLANAYTFVFHTSPNIPNEVIHGEDIPIHEYFHWYIEILPRDFRSSKYKREDEFHVVSITPEDAADALKSQNI